MRRGPGHHGGPGRCAVGVSTSSEMGILALSVVPRPGALIVSRAPPTLATW